jgi:hypothetical protein
MERMVVAISSTEASIPPICAKVDCALSSKNSAAKNLIFFIKKVFKKVVILHIENYNIFAVKQLLYSYL